jgi:hypothetical protein
MKKLCCAMSALMGVSLFLSGCKMEVEVEKLVPVPGPSTAISCDVMVNNFDSLKYYLNEPDISVVGIAGNVRIAGSMVIPADKTVYILDGSLDTNYKTLTVKGTVYVGYAAVLDVSNGYSDISIVEGGSVTVLDGGGLLLYDDLNIKNGSYGSKTALGTNTVTVDGGTLVVKKLKDKAAIENAFSSVKKGLLVVESLTDASGVMPSDILTITGISENRQLAVSLEKCKKETETSLAIPEWLKLTVYKDALDDVKTLTINGTLEVNSALTISGDKTLSIAGELMVGPTGALTIEKEVTIPEYGILTLYEGGKFTTTATGKAVFGKTTFGGGGGVGTWTASAIGGSDSNSAVNSVSIVSFEEGAVVAFNKNARSDDILGILIASGTPVITQAAGWNNAFVIWANTVIELSGTGDDKAGQITLESGKNPGKLTFYSALSMVFAGNETAGSAVSGTNKTIGGKAIISNGLSSDDFKNANGKLFMLGGSNKGYITASKTAGQDVEINSTVAISG